MGNLNRIVTGALLGLVILAPVHATDRWGGQDEAYYAYAKVTDVQPVVRIVQVYTPQEICWDEQVRHTNHRRGRHPGSYTPVVLGGILGGVVGNQFGGGRGQDVMTVAGALLGASIGRDAAYRRQSRYGTTYGTELRCEIEEVMHEEERIEGYQVSYEFQGRKFVTRTESDPGPEIRLRVQVDPAGYPR